MWGGGGRAWSTVKLIHLLGLLHVVVSFLFDALMTVCTDHSNCILMCFVKIEIEVSLPIFDKICPQQNQRRCHVSVCLVISEVFVTGKWTAR